MGLRGPELLLIFAILVVLFGATRLPALGGSIGQAIRNFKKGFNEPDETPSSASTDAKKVVPLNEGKDATAPSSQNKAKEHS